VRPASSKYSTSTDLAALIPSDARSSTTSPNVHCPPELPPRRLVSTTSHSGPGCNQTCREFDFARLYNLVSYELRDGTYVIPKVMDSGYLQLGKKRMDFKRKG